MATNLRLLHKIENRSAVTNLEISNVFSADYDIYKVTISNGTISGNPDYHTFRVMNSSGSDSGSNYRHAVLQIPSHQSEFEGKSTGTTHFQYGGRMGTNHQEGVGHDVYFFNPFDSTKFTYIINASSSFEVGTAMYGFQGICVHEVQESILGFSMHRTGSFVNFDVSVFGVE